MSSSRFAQFFLIVSVCSINTALGQHAHQPTGAPAGHWRSGRYIGYVPKHLQIQRPGFQHAGPCKSPSAERQTSTDSVVQTFFQEDVPIEDLPGEQVPFENLPGPAGSAAASLDPNGAVCGDVACDSTCAGATDVPCCSLWMWGRMDVLLWWTKGMNIPPLVTTSPEDTAQDQAGVLGDPNTTILFGNDKVNDDMWSGGRFTLGVWLDPCQMQGIDVTYMFLGEESSSFFGSNNDFTILARPFFNAQTNQEDSRLIVFPNVVNGSLFVDVTSKFQAAEVLYRRAAIRSCGTQLDYYFGYRFAELEDRVAFDEFTRSLTGATVGSTIDLVEQFDTRNTFNGGQLGLKMVTQPTPLWSAELGVKFAVGGTESRAVISGERTSTNAAGDSATTQGGLLAQQTNIGRFEESEFTTITEVGINLRRHIQCGVTASIGYTFLYWSDVNRAGDLIDLSVNPTQIPPGTLDGTARPAFAFRSTDFWAQGLNFGLEYNF